MLGQGKEPHMEDAIRVRTSRDQGELVCGEVYRSCFDSLSLKKNDGKPKWGGCCLNPGDRDLLRGDD